MSAQSPSDRDHRGARPFRRRRAGATQLLNAASAERGQAAIAIAVAFFLMLVAGGMVLDIGLWLGDKREAQTSADLAALAGSLELPSFEDDEGASAAANSAAIAWAQANDVDPATLTVEVVDTCFSSDDEVNTGVRVSIERTAQMFFLGLFSDIIPTIRAEAVACSGVATSSIGFMPWALETTGPCFQDDPSDPAVRIPIYGQRCDIVVGGSESESGSIGQLGFLDGSTDCSAGDSSASTYEQHVINGVDRACAVGDGVTSNPGVNVGKTRTGLKTRLESEGACAAAAQPFFSDVQDDTTQFNEVADLIDLPLPDLLGIDDFFEVWRPDATYDASNPARNLVTLDCDSAAGLQSSPRNIVIIMINDIGTADGSGCTGGAAGAKCYEIQGFARMYLEGCSTSSQGFRAKCNQGGSGGSFTIHARFVGVAQLTTGTTGLARYGDIQSFLKE